MDVICSGPWKRRVSFLKCGCNNSESSSTENYFSELYQNLEEFFDDDLFEGSIGIRLRLGILLLRFGIIVIVMPVWLILGFLSAGYLWPPQLRKKLLEQNITRQHREETLEFEYLEKRVAKMKVILSKELTDSREIIGQMRTDLKCIISDVSKEVKDIKQIVVSLSEFRAKGPPQFKDTLK